MPKFSLPALITLVKIRIERDNLWLGQNRCTPMLKPLWNIVVEYYAEDPRVLDNIVDKLYECSRVHPTLMWFMTNRFSGGIDISFSGIDGAPESWQWQSHSDMDAFTTLLIMPASNNWGDESPNIDNIPQLIKVRQYLYENIDQSLHIPGHIHRDDDD